MAGKLLNTIQADINGKKTTFLVAGVSRGVSSAVKWHSHVPGRLCSCSHDGHCHQQASHHLLRDLQVPREGAAGQHHCQRAWGPLSADPGGPQT